MAKKTPILMLILLAITAIGITISGVIFKQSALRMIPLYVSLVIFLLQSSVNRFAPLIGGINAVFYAIVYFYYELYATAIYSLIVSCPLQIITFINWSKRKNGKTVNLKSMTVKGRILTTLAFLGCWVIMYIVMSKLGSSYMMFDNTITLFGILITILTMLAYVEYTYLMIPNVIISICMYVKMIADGTYEQTTFLFSSCFSLICNILAFITARKAFKKQQTKNKELL